MEHLWYGYPPSLVIFVTVTSILGVGGLLAHNTSLLLSGPQSWSMTLAAIGAMVWGGGVLGYVVGRCEVRS